MSPLSNTKHEKFVLAVFEGSPARTAYRAHVSPNVSDAVADSAASRLLKSVKVAARLKELQNKVATRMAEKVIVTRNWVLEKLKRNADIAMGDQRIRISRPVKSKIKTEGGYEEKVETVEVDVTQRDGPTANRALELLGREVEGAPLFVERREIGMPGDFDGRTDDDLIREFESLTGGAAAGRGHSGRTRTPRNPKTLQ